MKSISYKLTGTTQQLQILVTDILGREFTIYRQGAITEQLFSDGMYTVEECYFTCIKYYAFKEGIRITDDHFVKVARIVLVDSIIVPVELVVNYQYHWFKPSIKYSNKLKCVMTEISNV